MIHPWHDVIPGDRLPQEFTACTFQDYKQLEGKTVEVDKIQAAASAYPVIEDALQRYSEARGES